MPGSAGLFSRVVLTFLSLILLVKIQNRQGVKLHDTHCVWKWTTDDSTTSGSRHEWVTPSQSGISAWGHCWDTSHIPWMMGKSSDHYIHYTSTFTYLPDNVSCPMPWHEWDATCEPGHFKCTECPLRRHYWGFWTSRKSGGKGLITHTCKHARQTTKRLRLLYHQTRR